jgi:hypothetical protein
VSSLAGGVARFWSGRTDPTPAAVFRVAFGLLAIWSALSVGANVERFFTDDGLVPFRLVAKGHSLFAHFGADASVAWMHFGVFLIAAVLFTIGLVPRLMGVVIGLVHVSLQARNPFILNGGDRLFSILAVLSATLPLSHRWSIQSLWRARRGAPQPPAPAVLGARLLQFQLAYIYADSAYAKVAHPGWRDGHFMRAVIANPVFAEWPLDLGSGLVIATMTYGALGFELAFPVLIWFRRLRVPLLVAGIAFHVVIDVVMIIPMFSAAMVALYLGMMDGDDHRRLRDLADAAGRIVERTRAAARSCRAGERRRGTPVATAPTAARR